MTTNGNPDPPFQKITDDHLVKDNLVQLVYLVAEQDKTQPRSRYLYLWSYLWKTHGVSSRHFQAINCVLHHIKLKLPIA